MKTKSFFAAANGYTGFRSYFKEIFEPRKFERIYVIKGGPGTGKSTLMRNVCDFLKDEADLTEKIYCSSDRNSLDGIILHKNNRKIAILDGTSPHETDAKIPGAIDKIINLGEFFDEKLLISQRDDIAALNRKKAMHYQNAYEYLHLAGVFDESIWKKVIGAYTKPDIDFFESYIKTDKGEQKANCSLRLINSYGKDGLVALSKENFEAAKNYSVKGSFGSENLFMCSLKSYLDMKKIGYTLYPSPLSDKLIDGIYISSCDTFITTAFKYENAVETDRFISKERLYASIEFIQFCEEEKQKLLSSSKAEFEKASEEHFALEKIYSSSINFEAQKALIEGIVREIKEIF